MNTFESGNIVLKFKSKEQDKHMTWAEYEEVKRLFMHESYKIIDNLMEAARKEKIIKFPTRDK